MAAGELSSRRGTDQGQVSTTPASIAAARFGWSLLGSGGFILGVRHRGRAPRASADEGRDDHEQASQSSHDGASLPAPPSRRRENSQDAFSILPDYTRAPDT